MYTCNLVDANTWVVECDGVEFCVCSAFEGEKELPQKRAEKICEALNSTEKDRKPQ
jgi:hypothetical protein